MAKAYRGPTHVCHICLAVRDLQATKRFYEEVIGLKASEERIILEGTPGVVRQCIFRMGNLTLNIMAPIGPQSVVLNRSLERHGEGMSHFCFALTPKAMDRTFAKCKEQGIRLVGPDGELLKPGDRTAYTDPRVTHRTVIEMIDHVLALG